MKRIRRLALFSTMIFAVAACDSAPVAGPETAQSESSSVLAPPQGPADIVDTAIAAGFSRLVEAVQLAGLEDVLRGDGPFTVFAPTNDAFEALAAGLSPEEIEALANDPAALGGILTYHVVPGRVLASDLSDGLEVTTVQGETVRFTLNGGARVNDANIILTDVEASNGIIHVIDAVLLPPQAPAEPADIVDTAIAAGFSRLVEAVQLAGLEDVLRGDGPFTVFAPTNEAFEALAAGLSPEAIEALANDPAALGGILTYHVVPGRVFAADLSDGLEVTTVQGETVRFTLNGGARVNDANIILTDVEASNGVIHVIDAVLLPPQDSEEPSEPEEPTEPEEPSAPADIVDTAIAAGFSRLVEAVQLAGLEEVLRGDGPFTVFAPTNEAFEALAAGLSPEAIEALANDPAALVGILTYHVVPVRVFAADLSDGLEVTTVQGETVRFTLNGGARVNDANIILTDVEASNGVIHVIDAVLLPPQE